MVTLNTPWYKFSDKIEKLKRLKSRSKHFRRVIFLQSADEYSSW
uniref:Uncharacterized protein n=1 Tax=Anguilla anguilla TaxID=7936 RepID=A0A0E9V1R5_ANGAN